MVNSTDVWRGRHTSRAEGGIDPRTFRDVLGGFASGVVVISGMSPGGPVGLTCQAFASLSIDPPLVAFCPSLSSVTWRRLRPVGAFCANVLAEGQQGVSELFGRRRDDKFQKVDWHRGKTGAPLIKGAAAHIECELEEIYPGGDHEVVVGRVVSLAGAVDRMPLLYHRGRYATLAVPSDGAPEV